MTNAQINRLADNGANNNNNDGGVGGKIRSSSVEPDGLSWPSIGTRERLTESED